MKTWRFGLIGCGAIADFHIRAITDLDNARITAVSSRNGDKAGKTGAQVQCEWTTDYRELLARNDVDIVAVTTSSGSHAEIGLEVLEAGKHLIIEKPVAMKAADARKMIRTAQARGVTFAVVSQRRFEPQHQLLRRLLDEGALGKLHLIETSVPFFRSQAYYDSASWRGTIDQDGGALMNQGIHSIDLFLWYGGSVSTVYGKIATMAHRMEAEDVGLAIVWFGSGTLGTIMASTAVQPGFPATLNLYGERGTVKLSGMDIVHWSVPGFEQPVIGESASYGGVADPLSIDYRYHRLQLAELLQALDSGRTPLVTGEDGLRSVQLIEGIYESSRLGKEQVIDRPEDV